MKKTGPNFNLFNNWPINRAPDSQLTKVFWFGQLEFSTDWIEQYLTSKTGQNSNKFCPSIGALDFQQWELFHFQQLNFPDKFVHNHYWLCCLKSHVTCFIRSFHHKKKFKVQLGKISFHQSHAKCSVARQRIYSFHLMCQGLLLGSPSHWWIYPSLVIFLRSSLIEKSKINREIDLFELIF